MENLHLLPFHIVTLTHPDPAEAVAYGVRLGDDALPELRLDLFPEEDPVTLIDGLHRRCLVTCRRRSEGGQWPDSEEAWRLEHLKRAVSARPQWVDLEWDVAEPAWLHEHRAHIRLLRSVHVGEGVFDLEARLKKLPPGDAYKWVGRATTLADNARVKAGLTWARQHRITLSAFLMGAKGIPSRVLQAAWGGSFTYVAPDGELAAAPGQLQLNQLRAMRAPKLHGDVGLCGVIGSPVLHSKGPDFHNPRFQRNYKDLIYLPLECADAQEAKEALEALAVLGLSITSPLKESLPAALGLQGPLNTLWRRHPGEAWQGANTDADALLSALKGLPRGLVLILGGGGVASTSAEVLARSGFRVLQATRNAIPTEGEVRASMPVGVIQATSLGMSPNDEMPFPGLLEAALPSLKWALEWIYKEETAFSDWAKARGVSLIDGSELFDLQAEAQSRKFILGCGG